MSAPAQIATLTRTAVGLAALVLTMIVCALSASGSAAAYSFEIENLAPANGKVFTVSRQLESSAHVTISFTCLAHRNEAGNLVLLDHFSVRVGTKVVNGQVQNAGGLWGYPSPFGLYQCRMPVGWDGVPPGRYYWQAVATDCTDIPCTHNFGPISTFVVRFQPGPERITAAQAYGRVRNAARSVGRGGISGLRKKCKRRSKSAFVCDIVFTNAKMSHVTIMRGVFRHGIHKSGHGKGRTKQITRLKGWKYPAKCNFAKRCREKISRRY